MDEKKGQKRKYVLFKKDGDDAGPKQCAFFASEAGCRNGSSCMFLHTKNGETIPTKATSSPSVVAIKPVAAVSVAPRVPAVALPSAPASIKKVKVIDDKGVVSAQNTPSSKSRLNIENDEEESSSLLFGAVNVALNQYTPVEKSLRRREGGKKTTSGKKATIDVLDHDHTAKVLSTSGTTHATMGTKTNLNKKFESVAAVAVAAAPAVPQKTNKPVPTFPSNADGNIPSNEDSLLREALSLVSASKPGSSLPVAKVRTLQDILHPGATEWLPLVEASRLSHKYEKDYTFPTDDPAWCGSELGHGKGHPVLAIDCEMCSTIDPVTNERNPMTLIRFSLISPTEVLVDSLVNPEQPVADMRTGIHGISEAEVVNVQFTLRHAQAIMKAYCGEGSVVVGHALYNDLRTLKFRHSVVVDTSYLYTIENEPGQAPSIRDISEAVLNNSMDSVHDSVMDAKASLNAAEYVLKNGVHPPIPRSVNSSARQLSAGLLIHRVPQGCDEQALSDMMSKLCSIVPTLVQPIQWTKDGSGVENGKAMVFFLSKEHADLAFDALPGPNRPDKSNRPQKRAYLKGGGYMCIRKNFS